MSPPLVVAYALAGTMEIDLQNDPIGKDREDNDVFLRDIWPTQAEVAGVIEASIDRDLFERSYANVFAGDEKWGRSTRPSAMSSLGKTAPPISRTRLTSRECLARP